MQSPSRDSLTGQRENVNAVVTRLGGLGSPPRGALHGYKPATQSALAPNQKDCVYHGRENVRVAKLPDDFDATMQEFLRATSVIDCDAGAIVAAARAIAGEETDDEVVARRCFLWVRDEVRHSSDFELPTVTCAASEVLRHRIGFCYGKSHLLAALLRARKIPAALCYQRLAEDEAGTKFFLHGLVAIHLEKHGWYRVDPRGGKRGSAPALIRQWKSCRMRRD